MIISTWLNHHPRKVIAFGSNINFEIWSSEPMAIVMALVPSHSKRDNDDDDGDGDVMHTCMHAYWKKLLESESVNQTGFFWYFSIFSLLLSSIHTCMSL